jgi:hypothetical protein
MRTMKMVEREFVTCDVCGLPVTSSYTSIGEGKDKKDACGRWWPQKQTRCVDILMNQCRLEFYLPIEE